ncbi:unnamed protein product [Lymnaea stagnalis]|uniref:Uncharacterized protein n=1 Tax=Lymnaea stagnalis TaxID=6523 RepID=A0AAV2H114_LYMST
MSNSTVSTAETLPTTATVEPTSEPTSTTASSAGDANLSVGATVGIVVGGVVVLVVIVALITLLVCRIHKKRNRRQPPTLPHPDDIHPSMFTESRDVAHRRNSDEVANDHDDDEDKGKTNIVFIDSDDDLPQPHSEFQNNNKPHHTPDNSNTSSHNSTPHNKTSRNNTPYHPPKKPLVPKSNSESVINRYCDQTTQDQGAGSFPRQRGGSLKPPDEDYIQMGGNSPILNRTLSPPTACKPLPGHGYINVLNDDQSASSDSEPDLDRNSDVYENFGSPPFTAATTLCDTDEDRSAGQEKTPKYINVDKIVPQLTPNQKPDGRLCDDDISEDEEQLNYINMENPSLLSPTSEFFTEKLNESLREAGHSAEQPSYPHAPRQGHPPTTAAKPKPDKSKGKSPHHKREPEHSAETETPVLFKTGKSNSAISTLSNSDFPKPAKNSPANSDFPKPAKNSPANSDFPKPAKNSPANSDFPKPAKNSPALKRVLRKASNVDTNQLEKQIELDSTVDAENSDHDDLYENSAEFFNISPQVLESSLIGAGASVPENITSDRPKTPVQSANDNVGTDRTRTPPQGAQRSRKPPAVLPKSVVKNNQETSDISQLKFRLKKTAYNESV